MKKRFKVASDTSGRFNGVELDYVLTDEGVGSDMKLFGESFTLTQNGSILVLVSSDCCITLQDITPVEEITKPKLIINDTLDIFTATNEVAVKCECTYAELFEELEKEWKFISELTSSPLPFSYNAELALFTFHDSWGFENGDFSKLSDGSFERKSADGKSL